MAKKFATGTTGNWFATVRNGERLPCLLNHYRGMGNAYHEDFNYDLTNPRHAEFIAALQAGRAIIRTIAANGKMGYIEGTIFNVVDVRIDPVSGLTCRIAGTADRV